MPARILPDILCSNPPIDDAFPNRSTSPVMATLRLIYKLLNRLYIATAIAIPADGPSFLTAPFGQ